MPSEAKAVESVPVQAPSAPGQEVQAPPDAGSLTLADALEAEFVELTGEESPPPASWEFSAGQFLQPRELRARLLEGRDAAARSLAARELKDLAAELVAQGEPQSEQQLEALRATLAAGFNALLERADLYAERAEHTGDPSAAPHLVAHRFAQVRFRPLTRERIDLGPLRERNRCVLEDAFPEIRRREDARLAAIFARAHKRKLAALCLSGGGIRSASFALGVVQGLARLGLLGRFDYLSTVSGGGYLGGWLSAWMHRAGRERVIEELSRPSGRPLDPEPAAVSHIRNYGSYLSPRIGLMSTDSWTLAAIYLRNLLLNWLVLLPLLAAALLLPQLLLALMRLPLRPVGQANLLDDVMFLLLLAAELA